MKLPLALATLTFALACWDANVDAGPPQPAKGATPPATAAERHRGGRHERSEERPAAALVRALRVVSGGKELEPWGLEQLSKVPTRDEGGKQAWDLRALVGALAGANTRVAVIVGQGGTRVEITEAEWADATRTPLLRVNRQGHLKLSWAGPKHPGPGHVDELREVTKLELVERAVAPR